MRRDRPVGYELRTDQSGSRSFPMPLPRPVPPIRRRRWPPAAGPARRSAHGEATPARSSGERNKNQRVAIRIFRQLLKPHAGAEHVAIQSLDLIQQRPIDADHAAEHRAGRRARATVPTWAASANSASVRSISKRIRRRKRSSRTPAADRRPCIRIGRDPRAAGRCGLARRPPSSRGGYWSSEMPGRTAAPAARRGCSAAPNAQAGQPHGRGDAMAILLQLGRTSR